MKTFRYFPVLVLLFLTSVSFAPAAFVPPTEEGGSTPAFTVERLLIAGSVESLEPVGVVDVFASSTERVYCFLEARDIQEDTEISFVWFLEDEQKAKVTLPLLKGARWRTYSSKRLGGVKGVWRVELHDEGGNVINTAQFVVE